MRKYEGVKKIQACGSLQSIWVKNIPHQTAEENMCYHHQQYKRRLCLCFDLSYDVTTAILCCAGRHHEHIAIVAYQPAAVAPQVFSRKVA